MYYNYGRKRVNDWMKEVREPGMNKRGARYFLEFKEIRQEFGRNNSILYFLIKEMNMKELNSLLGSHIKQKKLVNSVIDELKKYCVTEEWEPVFDRDVKSLHERTRYVLSIIKANIKLTELYPYFETVGFDRLMDFSVKRNSGDDDATDELRDEIQKWNAEHSEVIRKHMEDTAEERANLEAHRERIAESNRREKEARKIARRQANAEVKEIRENNRKYLMRKKKIDRQFERYYH